MRSLRRRFVHQVDRLVGQEAVGDVAIGKHRRRHQRRVLESAPRGAPRSARAVRAGWRSCPRPSARRRRPAGSGARAPRPFRCTCGTRRASSRRCVQLTARQHRLQHVRRVHRAFGRAGADDGVQLVDEQNDWPCDVGDFLQDGLQALFEFAAILGAGDRARPCRARRCACSCRPSGTSPRTIRCGQTFDDGGLADAGLADQHRVVLGAARQHLDDAADFFVAADHRIELALARELGQIAAVAFERLVGALGILAGDALRAADARQRRKDLVARQAAFGQQPRRGGAAGSDAIATSRCSVLTKSSFSRSASACARSVTT